MCFDFIYNFYLKCFSFCKELSKILSQIWKRLHVKYLLFLSDFNWTRFLATYFRKKFQIWTCIKICRIGVDGQTDMPKLIVAFLNFANALEKDSTSDRMDFRVSRVRRSTAGTQSTNIAKHHPEAQKFRSPMMCQAANGLCWVATRMLTLASYCDCVMTPATRNTCGQSAESPSTCRHHN